MKNTYIYSVSSLLHIYTPYLCHIGLKISSLTAVTNCRLELQPVVTKIPKCDDRDTWRSGVRSAMRAASQLPGRGPTVVDMAPIPALNKKSDDDDDDQYNIISMSCTCRAVM